MSKAKILAINAMTARYITAKANRKLYKILKRTYEFVDSSNPMTEFTFVEAITEHGRTTELDQDGMSEFFYLNGHDADVTLQGVIHTDEQVRKEADLYLEAVKEVIDGTYYDNDDEDVEEDNLGIVYDYEE